MAEWIRLGDAAEVAEGSCRVYEVAGNPIALFKVEGCYFAIDNACVHQGGPLAEGTIQGKTVTCPWHFWRYDLTTGKTTSSDQIGVRAYPVEVRGADVLVDVAPSKS